LKLLLYFLFFISISFAQLPKGFTYISNIDESIKIELAYLTEYNFIGKPIQGYKKNVGIITKETAEALKEVQQKLKEFGLSLKILDAYRPQQAVNYFVFWAREIHDTIRKKDFYPTVDKKDLFKLGFIDAKSSHTRGSTVDLTIVDINSGEELDMGSTFDFFGKQSHAFYRNITQKQRSNRLLLRNLMLDVGFKPYDKEWWHFTLKKEPFPKKYFNFPVK